ncbi:hypothetical protein ACHAW6_007386 [Cyclotella cf. meneghiniana]
MPSSCFSPLRTCLPPASLYYQQIHKTSALQWSWILLNLSLYAFAIPWMLSGIINQYFISKNYDSTLPGLDDTAARIFFIGAHMGLGLVCLLLYPLQFFQCIRKRYPTFHRWSGRLSLISAVFASFCGLVFICLKKFRLVGGINMGIAFFLYGVVFGTCAAVTGYYARKREFRRHKNWAIRSYSQILATMLYRYYYAVLGGFGAVHSPDETNLECGPDDVCDYFLKPFDALHVWTFFLVPLLFAEAVVYLLRDQAMSDVNNVIENSKSYDGEKDDFNNDQDVAHKLKEKECTQEDTTMETNGGRNDRLETIEPGKPNSFLYLNIFGILFAIICLGSTIFIYVTSALGINTFKI